MQTHDFSNPLTATLAVGSGVLLGGWLWLNTNLFEWLAWLPYSWWISLQLGFWHCALFVAKIFNSLRDFLYVHNLILYYRNNDDDDSRLTKKAEPPPTRDVNRDSGTASANGGWLRRLVRPQGNHILISNG